MSSVQLDKIWRLEQLLQSLLLCLPKRSCSAKPDPDWGSPMPEVQFKNFQRTVIRMYTLAATQLIGKEIGEYGFGLFRRCADGENKKTPGNMIFNNTKSADLGYFINAPQIGECPTAHRYLRSPYEEHVYLGGPLSLCNHDIKGNLKVTFKHSKDHTTGNEYHFGRVFSKLPIREDKELLWDYYDGKPMKFPLHSVCDAAEVAGTVLFQDCVSSRSNTAPVQEKTLFHFKFTSSEQSKRETWVGVNPKVNVTIK